MKSYPPVTVLTLMYNTKPEYIIEGIKSVQRNNYPNLEHIFMDDCSPDPSHCNAVEKWIRENNYECRFIRNPVNQGVSKNLNDIIAMAKGKYLIGCCDDILTDDRIVKDVELFETLPEDYAIVCGFSQVIDGESNLQPIMSPNIPIVEGDNYFNELAKGNCISGPATTMKKEALKAIGGYDVNLLVEDYDMWLRLSNAGYKFKVRPAISIYYRVLATSLSRHPRLYLDTLKAKLKFPDRIPVKSALDQEIQIALKENNNEKLEQIIALYKKYFPSYTFIRLFEFVRFKVFRSFLLASKLKLGRIVLNMKS